MLFIPSQNLTIIFVGVDSAQFRQRAIDTLRSEDPDKTTYGELVPDIDGGVRILSTGVAERVTIVLDADTGKLPEIEEALRRAGVNGRGVRTVYRGDLSHVLLYKIG